MRARKELESPSAVHDVVLDAAIFYYYYLVKLPMMMMLLNPV